MDIFTKFKPYVKIKEIHIDNPVFQLHYKVTFVFLMLSGTFLAATQYFGEPIRCVLNDKMDVSEKIMNNYCWIHATFTLPNSCNKTSINLDVPHPCIEKSTNREEQLHHKYYQWVWLVCILQAVGFYLPHLVWKFHEDHLILKLVENLTKPLSKKKHSYKLVRYFRTYIIDRDFVRRVGEQNSEDLFTHDIQKRETRLSKADIHKRYFYYYTFAELLNFFNVAAQTLLINSFLSGMFTTYGLEVLEYSQMEQFERADPMIVIFPRLTKCTFHMYGPSGDIKRYDSLCLLPLNILNEKIYIFMWFWFVFLGVLSIGSLGWRVATLTSPRFRFWLLKRRARFVDESNLIEVFKYASVGNWFMLYQLSKNVDADIFGYFMARLVKNLRKKQRWLDDPTLIPQQPKPKPKKPESEKELHSSDDDYDDDAPAKYDPGFRDDDFVENKSLVATANNN